MNKEVKTKQYEDPKDENATTNTDTHEKKKDNELKNMEAEMKNVKDDKDSKDDDDKKVEYSDGKNRIVEANDADKKQHAEYSKKDAIPDRNANLMTVIANHTIVTLQTNTNIVPLVNAPLSSFAFGKSNRTNNGAYGITPYIISTEVPQLFKFVSLYNAIQQVNLPDLLAMNFSSEAINSTIAESIKIFNISTMTVRTELNDNLGHATILDPNSTQDGAMKLTTLIPASRQNPQASANFVENRIFSVVSAFNALDNVLVAIPKKMVALDSVRGGVVAESLAAMPFYEGMHPHPYYSVFSNLPDWARNYFNEAFTQNPLQIGDMAVDSYAGAKLSQTTKLIIDQYTAAVLRMNYQKLKHHTLTTNMLQTKIRASLFKHDKLEVESLCDLEDFSLLYDFTKEEYELFLFRMLTNSTTQHQVLDFLVSELEKTNRLVTTPIEDIWKGLLAGDIEASAFNQAWIGSINIGNASSPYQMLIYETFSDYFVFNPTFSAIPNSLEAITELMSIYTFMILYPRITQRCIHKIGYRLMQLYDAMFPGIYNAFRHEFGDVRTNWGKNKFNAYGYQISRTESQQGYVYSIFTPLVRLKTVDRNSGGNLQNLLNRFIGILNSIRQTILPTTYQYSLDNKRLAHYPYLYTNYSTYASWEPIAYGDYQNSQHTALGNKLKLIISYANEFKDLFTSQHATNSQIPRGFNSYFISWTSQLAKIVSTAGGVYQITCAMIQEALFNSPFYVGSQYNPEQNKFWYVPHDVGIAPLPSASLSSLVIPCHIPINDFKLNIGMCLAMSMEGEYMRNTLIPYEGEHDVQRSQYRQRNDITSLDGVECFKMMNYLVSESRKFGFAMQMTQWLTTPDDIDNPFQSLVFEISQYMKMASWVPLVKKIFAIFDVSFDSMFIRTMGPTEFLLDGRYLDRTLVLVDPTTAMALRQQPINSRFGLKMNYMVPMDIDKLVVLTKPLISQDSKIIYIHRDWYFGKMVVDELGPTQPSLKQTNWTDETTFNRYFRFRRIAYKNGQAASIEYKSDIDGMKRSMVLPYVAKNVPVLLINIEYTTELNLTYLRVLAKAISHGKIILRIKNFKIRVWIEDMPSRTDDYSEPQMSEDEVYKILSLPAGCIYEHKFKTTRYATNFSSEALVCPGYIQWFATSEPADRNIFTSTITNAIVRPTQTILPSADEMGYGKGEEGLYFTNDTLKTESNIINWNNSIPTVSTKLVNSIGIKIIPSLPQYLGAS